MRLIAFAIIGIPIFATFLASQRADRNLQDCWAKRGVNFACHGDGKYDPDRSLRRPE
ncbi:hypothetical protein AMC83_PA00035 (plasmid) [Rhizobium phaseoli]|uniref:hypothetical protein n=1 Tax=Rhizobium phaseoli TaxID=396 RepID=UPI0007F0B0E1|nr:hypothetical protein [Rhizobium phaseoli]ANL74262.1 hypothetical protein AMC83_PA00035 [Rhizobium phaseoli]